MSFIPKDFKTSINIAEKTIERIKKMLEPGLSEIDVAHLIRFWLRHFGAKKEAFRIIVSSGKRSTLIHGFASKKKLERGDIVMLDLGALYKGYRSDITRTFVLGKPTKKQIHLHKILLNAQRAAMKKIRPGMPCRIVDDAARSIIKKSGHAKYFRHSTGHGICYKTHEPPKISPRSRHMLKEGDVVTVEPGIYIKGWGGMRIEDMVLVTKNGHKLLTSISRELEV